MSREFAEGMKGGIPPFKEGQTIDLTVAHWCNWSPHISGMYETTRELVDAENRIEGVLAGFCETPGPGADDQRIKRCAEGGKKDPMHPHFRTQGWGWAMKYADIHIIHSTRLGKVGEIQPRAFFIHGTVEACLESELMENDRYASFSSAGGYIAKSQATFVTNERSRRMWSRWDYSGEKVHRVNKGIDLEWWKRASTQQDLTGKPSVLYGEIWRNIKHPMHLLHAVEEIYDENQDVVLNMWGCGTKPGFWRSIITAMRFDKFLGKRGIRTIVDYPEHYYSRGDVLVSPSVYGDVTRVHQEAMACGCPVISWDTDPYQDAHPYKYAKAFDFSDLAQKITEVYGAVLDDREGVAKQCRNLAERYFDINFEAQQIVTVLRDVISAQ